MGVKVVLPPLLPPQGTLVVPSPRVLGHDRRDGYSCSAGIEQTGSEEAFPLPRLSEG